MNTAAFENHAHETGREITHDLHLSGLTEQPVDLPQLAIVPLNKLLVHEWYDRQRTEPLVERIRSSGVFRNPPIVTPVNDNSGRCVVLDGANRTAAMQSMDAPHILVQMVGTSDPGLMLRTWNHILFEMEPDRLLESLKQVPGLDLVSSEEPYVFMPEIHQVSIALIQTPDGRIYDVGAPASDLKSRIDVLNRVVNCYKNQARLDRTSFNEIKPMLSVYPDLSVLVIFPKFNVSDLAALATSGCLLPPGITRTTIAPRALNVNLPLDVLFSGHSTNEKNRAMERLIRTRWENGRIHYYPEATFMFDE